MCASMFLVLLHRLILEITVDVNTDFLIGVLMVATQDIAEDNSLQRKNELSALRQFNHWLYGAGDVTWERIIDMAHRIVWMWDLE